MSRVNTPSSVSSAGLRAHLKADSPTEDFPGVFRRSTPKTQKNTFNLWVHTERDFRQELVLHPDHFPGLQVGDLVEITSTKEEEIRLDVPSSSAHVRNISLDSGDFTPWNRHQSGASLPLKRGQSSLFDEGFKSSKRLILQVTSLDRELVARQPQLQISVDRGVAQAFDLTPRTDVMVRKIEADSVTADYVELDFRDQYIGRADMWRLKNFINNTTVYTGKKIVFAGAIRARIREIYINGSLIDSAFVNDGTKAMFRSETAKFFIFIQMSKEMWDFDEEGELYQEKLLDGFLPNLFEKWREVGANHAVSIILFTRILYSATEAPIHDPAVVRNDQTGSYYKDFYRVVVDFESRSDWNTVLVQLKREFGNYVRDVLEHKQDELDELVVGGQIAPAREGNVLEAVNLALNPFDRHYVDRDLLRTGLSIVVITPGTGFFETNKSLLRLTAERMVDNGIALDLVCLSKQPLYTVPLFQYLSHEPHVMDRSPSPSFSGDFPDFIDSRSHRSPSGSIPNSHVKSSFQLRDPINSTVFSRRSIMISGSAAENPVFVDLETPWDPLEMDTLENSVTKAFFSIPHWVDISFWHRSTSDEDLNRFTLRCKMHEIEMMDEEGSNIIVPPLNLTRTKKLDEYDAYDVSLFEPIDNDISPGVSLAGSPRLGSTLLTQPSLENSSPRLVLSSSPKAYSSSPPRSRLAGSMEEATFDLRRLNLESPIRHASSSLSVSLAPAWSALAMTKLINPCNPGKNVMKMTSAIRRWRHIFPRLEQYAETDPEMNWKSLCTPASLPLTTDFFPTPEELAKYYQEYTYSLAPTDFLGDEKSALQYLLTELVYQRLNQGYQVVVAPSAHDAIFFQRGPTVPGATTNLQPPGFAPGTGWKMGKQNNAYYLSLGDNLHKIASDSFGNNVEVTRYVKKDTKDKDQSILYRCVIWPRHCQGYVSRTLHFRSTSFLSYNWNYLDHLIAGYEVDMIESLRFWRSRFLLIPLDAPPSSLLLPSNDHLDEEELRLAGFFKFLELFEKAQVDTEGRPLPNNPLPLQLTTSTPAEFVANEWLKTDLSTSFQITPDSAQRAVVLKMSSTWTEIADAMKSQNGVPFKDRRWHLKTYESTFLGSECVDWMISAFSDINTREEAVQFGDQLLEQGFFIHVKQKHRFLDGYYYYRLHPDFSPTRRPVKPSMVKRAESRLGDNDLALIRKRTESGEAGAFRIRTDSGDVRLESPIHKTFDMSHRILVDMDPQKRSDRTEIAALHHDTLYNPKGCYHFQIHWLSCTARLMEDILITWARFAEKCGLRMVEAPVEQTLGFSEHNPFQSVVPIHLAVEPPVNVSGPDIPELWFETELLRSHGFLLDVENDDQFPSGSVAYSYSKSRFAHTQYVHRSGVAFVQILGGTRGFLWSDNRLLTSSSSSISRQASQASSALPNPDKLRVEFQAVCQDVEGLSNFWKTCVDKLTMGSLADFIEMEAE